jgi:pyroglutamyl-peptidase
VSNIVLTGFGAFPGVPDNPTQRLVEHFRQDPSDLPVGTALHLLDVDYRTVGKQIDALLHKPPRALILTGYSNLATAITLEARAHGLCSPDKPDAMGHIPPKAATVPTALHSTANLKTLSDALAAENLPAKVSHDAGQYLCNFSYRHALQRVDERGFSTQVLFIHLPALSNTPLADEAAASLPMESMVRALSCITRELAA